MDPGKYDAPPLDNMRMLVYNARMLEKDPLVDEIASASRNRPPQHLPTPERATATVGVTCSECGSVTNLEISLDTLEALGDYLKMNLGICSQCRA